MKTTVDIFSGFLGSGKTMLIKKLLTEDAYNKNTVIIENEFGEVSIDGEILRESNIEVKEINSGCICCQVSGKFDDAVLEVLNKYNPENIIIEPSGVAKLSEILNILTSIKFEHMLEVRNVFTLIDVQNYENYIKNFKEFYENQIRRAGTIVLSRTQLAEKKLIDKVTDSVRKYNKNAQIVCRPWNELNAQDFMGKSVVKSEKQKNHGLTSGIKSMSVRKESHDHSHNADEVFESYPISLDNHIDTEEIKKKFMFISESSKYGNVIRAKGICENKDGVYYQFDYVPNEFKIRKIRWSNRKVVSIIGSSLNKKELSELFR